jgi:hypothetical protein
MLKGILTGLSHGTSRKNPASFFRFPGVFLLGFFLLFFSFLRLYHWQPRELLIAGSIGLLLVLLGLRLSLDAATSSQSTAGPGLCSLAIILYLFLGTVSDLVALLYAAGVTLMILELTALRFSGNFPGRSGASGEENLQDPLVPVQGSPVPATLPADDLALFALDLWKMEQRLDRVQDLLPEAQKRGIGISLQKLKNLLARHGVEARDYTGRAYNEGLNVEILNVEDDPSVPGPVIRETVEPAVFSGGRLVKKAKVIIAGR